MAQLLRNLEAENEELQRSVLESRHDMLDENEELNKTVDRLRLQLERSQFESQCGNEFNPNTSLLTELKSTLDTHHPHAPSSSTSGHPTMCRLLRTSPMRCPPPEPARARWPPAARLASAGARGEWRRTLKRVLSTKAEPCKQVSLPVRARVH